LTSYKNLSEATRALGTLAYNVERSAASYMLYSTTLRVPMGSTLMSPTPVKFATRPSTPKMLISLIKVEIIRRSRSKKCFSCNY